MSSPLEDTMTLLTMFRNNYNMLCCSSKLTYMKAPLQSYAPVTRASLIGLGGACFQGNMLYLSHFYKLHLDQAGLSLHSYALKLGCESD